MVGGGSRKDKGSLMISNTNVFAALDSLKKKKKSDKKSEGKSSKGSESESEPQVFWAPAPLNVKSWADVDDDDDYYATTAPPQSVWNVPQPHSNVPKHESFEIWYFMIDRVFAVQDSESEDMLDEGDDDVEEEHDPEPDYSMKPEPELQKHNEVPAAPKEAERHLSKKERKKKELAELDALLADFGVTQKESIGQDESQGNNVELCAILFSRLNILGVKVIGRTWHALPL
ncbi:hypothetical protein TanjilG_13976 [Lupinus angustifolius]|uniref:Uncharacterized protein n=1 Tax=Lupinus angustifolius TaxID=3871 RepID=A0A1J7IJB6_LUPAN|nr:hypothetical protein TanjilG_13976 [Lupinus angustifolius]